MCNCYNAILLMHKHEDVDLLTMTELSDTVVNNVGKESVSMF